ncbi:MAG: TIGR00341 family protein [Phycisphaerales bacterium]|jgi:uncharacterized hydrophobic protein (TIGR00341 family)
MALRMIEVVILRSRADEAAKLLEETGGIGVWASHVNDDQSLVRVLVANEQSEAAVVALERQHGSDAGFRLMIFEVQATLPRPTDDEPKPPADGAAPGEEKPKDPERIACEELVQQLSDNSKLSRVYVASVVLSVIVAAIGLIRNDVAVIIGAMVIAPLLSPNMTLALATTLGDIPLGRKAIKVNLAGVGLAGALATLIGAVVPFDPEVAQIAGRTHVALSDVALALAAGSAGALAVTTGLSAALVGVMVAVALMPPLVAFGLLLGSGHETLALGALLLTSVNIVCVNIAGVATFLLQKIRPNRWWQADRANRMVKRAAAGWVFVLVVLIVLIVISQK